MDNFADVINFINEIASSFRAILEEFLPGVEIALAEEKERSFQKAQFRRFVEKRYSRRVEKNTVKPLYRDPRKYPYRIRNHTRKFRREK